MSLYPRLATTAARLIAQFGQPWTITRTTGPAATTTRTVNGVAVAQVRHLLGESGVDIGDTELLLDGAANPQKAERIGAGGKSFIIMQVEPIQPAAIVLAWRVWVRAG